MIRITAQMQDGSPLEHRAMNDLRACLDATGVMAPNRAGTPGGKGVATDILVNPATPVAIMAAVRALRLWMKRDRRRSLTLSRTSEGKDERIVISGDMVSIEVLEAALTELLRRDDPPKALTDEDAEGTATNRDL